MSETFGIRTALLQILKQATEDSVANIPAPNHSAVVEIDKYTLTAMMVLLSFHPDENAAKFYNNRILRILKGEENAKIFSNPEKPKPAKIKSVQMPTHLHDPYMEAVNLIAEYGKFLIEQDEKKTGSA